MNLFEEEIISFLALLNKHDVRFILVGGLAVNYYGYSRSTGDVDLWLDDSAENRAKLVGALAEFGVQGGETFLTAPLIAGYSEVLLDNGIYVDLMSDLKMFKPGDFEECYRLAERYVVNEREAVPVLHINKLIQEKENSTRSKDVEDVVQLKKIVNKRKG